MLNESATTITPGEAKVNTDFERYWGQPVGSKKFNVPLDQFVRLAGMTAHALAPDEFGGRLGKGLSKMGHEASVERARRERETPNELLRQRLANAQLKKLEEEAPKAWDIIYKDVINRGGTPTQALQIFEEIKRTPVKPNYYYVVDNAGNVSVWADEKLMFGSGKGKDITNEVSETVTDNAGNTTLINKNGSVS